MSTGTKVGICILGVVCFVSILSLINFLGSDLSALTQETNQAYVTGRIAGAFSIPAICIFVIIRMVIKSKNNISGNSRR